MSGNNDYINLIIFLLDDIKSYCVGSGLTFVGFCVMKWNYSLDFCVSVGFILKNNVL